MQIRRVPVVLAAVAALISTAVLANPPAARAAGVVATLKVSTHNVDGARDGRHGLATALDYTIGTIKKVDSSVVLLQEICVHQLRYVREQLEKATTTHTTYDIAFARTQGDTSTSSAPNPCADTKAYWSKDPTITDIGRPIRNSVDGAPALTDQSYGNAVIVRGSITSSSGSALPTPSGDYRTYPLLCANATIAPFGTGRVKACSVHLATTAVGSDPQVARIAERLKPFVYGTSGTTTQQVVVGGDLNTQPSESGLNPLYHITNDQKAGSGAYVEADEYDQQWWHNGANDCTTGANAPHPVCRNGEYTHRNKAADGSTLPRSRKYDYLFFSDGSGRSGAAATATNANEAEANAATTGVGPIGAPPSGFSDHLFYYGQAKISFPG